MHIAFKDNHVPSPRRLQMPVLHLHRTRFSRSNAALCSQRFPTPESARCIAVAAAAPGGCKQRL